VRKDRHKSEELVKHQRQGPGNKKVAAVERGTKKKRIRRKSKGNRKGGNGRSKRTTPNAGEIIRNKGENL